jgi:hypothetical protein
MISKLKKLWKTISKDTQHSLVDLISKRVEMKLEETKHEMLESELMVFKCSDEEFISGLETVYISDYILNWLKNAEAQKMNSPESMQKMEEFKHHFENNDKGCGWKFSQALIGEYIEMNQGQSGLYDNTKTRSFMGAWLMRLCYGSDYKIDMEKARHIGTVLFQ